MIPKIIHYIWFGSNQMSERMEKCIKSWHRYLPDYEYMLWNEQTFDISKSCKFVQEAYERKKFAFVSDYVRIWALNRYGGVYMDTDIEVLRPFDEDLFEKRMVLGTDDGGHLTALMMSEPKHTYTTDVLAVHENMSFVKDDGTLNTEVNNTLLQNRLKKYGYKIANVRQSLSEGIEVYPDDWFHVRSLTSGRLNLTSNSQAIHWHTISWVSFKIRLINFVRINILVPLMGERIYSRLTRKIKNGKTTF